MFCKQCGTNLPEGAKVCPNCGMAVEQSAQATQSTSNQAASTPSAQPAQLPTVNKEFVLRNINTILAVVAVVLMFLPMLSINGKELGYGNKLSVSGFEIAQGLNLTDGSGTSSNFLRG